MRDDLRPPRLAERLLGRLLPADHWDAALGDFEEQFRWRVDSDGAPAARRWYWRQVLLLIPERAVHHLVWGILMLQNYFTMALRHIRTNLGYASINILGLAVGLASFAVISLYVADELSYDTYHEKADRIFRVLDFRKSDGVGEESSSAPTPLGEAMLADFPGQVENVVRFFDFQAPAMTVARPSRDGNDVVFNESGVFFTDASVFSVFDWRLGQGDPATALVRPYSVVMTREMARKYFPGRDPMGRILRLERQHDLTVTGVIEDVPANSHFTFDFLVSFSTLDDPGVLSPRLRENWIWNPTWTYLLLAEDADPRTLESQFQAFVGRHFREDQQDRVRLHLQPLTAIHLTPGYDYEIAAHNDIAYVWLFSAIAGFILIIAGINFVNLSTARATRRAAEVGVRKVLGAHRMQLFKQFLGESLIWSLLAALISVPLIWLALPVLNGISGKSLTFYPLGDPVVTAALFGTAVLLGLAAGAFPAVVLARFDTASALKGASLGVSGFSTATWRKMLVVGQFAMSVVLIVCTIVAGRQLVFLQNSDLGFDSEQVVLLPSLRSPVMERYDAFKHRILEDPRIEAVTAVEEIPGVKHQTGSYLPEGKSNPVQFPRLIVHDDFARTMGIEVIAGRGFRQDFPNDADESVVVNEALIRQLDWGSPERALGRGIDDRRVTGVVRDFHFSSLRRAVGPFLLMRMEDTPASLAFSARYVAVRIRGGDVDQALGAIETAWSEFAPGSPFETIFLDSVIGDQYAGEAAFRTIAGAFSLLAIFIASLGLLGLVSYMAARRRKEFGVRKVNGAAPKDLVLLMAGGFLKLVAGAVIVAWPVTYFVLDRWLDAFAYRIELGAGPFLISGVLVVLIAAVTLAWHALRAALADPVESLRYE
jgi:putative ABC transport system permease protein